MVSKKLSIYCCNEPLVANKRVRYTSETSLFVVNVRSSSSRSVGLTYDILKKVIINQNKTRLINY